MDQTNRGGSSCRTPSSARYPTSSGESPTTTSATCRRGASTATSSPHDRPSAPRRCAGARQGGRPPPEEVARRGGHRGPGKRPRTGRWTGLLQHLPVQSRRLSGLLMRTANRMNITATPSWHSPLTSGTDIQKVRLSNKTLTITREKNRVHRLESTDLVGARLTEGVFSNELVLTTKSGTTTKVGGLPKRESRRIKEELQRQIAEETRAQLEQKAQQSAKEITPLISELDIRIQRFTSKERYTRYSEAAPLQDAAKRLAERCNAQTEDKLSPALRRKLGKIRRASDPQSIEEDRNNSNLEFLQRTESLIQNSTRDVLPSPLTNVITRRLARREVRTWCGPRRRTWAPVGSPVGPPDAWPRATPAADTVSRSIRRRHPRTPGHSAAWCR